MTQKLTFPDKPRNLTIGDELNRGAWGAVYNGDLEGRAVAVKRIHELLYHGGGEEERRKLLEDFREECKKLQTLIHQHVVGFIGAFNDPRLGPILVMEKMQENLRQFLDKWKNNLQLPKQLRISLEIIRGVAFLHQQTPPLVHRDLNDKNVMFSFEGVIKIGDFGQSKLKKDLYLTTGQPGMVTFMPPEALDVDESKYNESLDIFSVGVLMLEIGTQQEPKVNLRGIGITPEVERRERDLKVLGEDHPLRQPVLLCLNDNPKERPKASDLQSDVLAMVDGGAEAEVTNCDADIKQLEEKCEQLKGKCEQLKEKCEQLEAQATTYKLDFEKAQTDRKEVIGKFERERKAFQADIAKLNDQLTSVHLEHDDTLAQLQWLKELSLPHKYEEVLPQSPLPPSLGKGVRSIRLPDIPVGGISYGATNHNSKVYISAACRDENGMFTYPVLMFSTNEHKWSALPEQQSGAAIAVVNNHVTLIGGRDVSTGKFINTLSTWYEGEGRWKQTLPPTRMGRGSPAVFSHDSLLLVTGGVAEDNALLNTTDVLGLTTMKWTTPKGLNLPVPLWRHHLTLCGEYLYLVGGAVVYPWQSTKDDNTQAWRAKWSDVKQTAAPQHSQPQRSVWTRIADPLTLRPTVVSCGGTLYTVGGRTRDDIPIKTVYTYITARNQWVSVGDMSMRRIDHCVVPLSSNAIFVAVGRVLSKGKYTLTPLTELLLL